MKLLLAEEWEPQLAEVVQLQEEEDQQEEVVVVLARLKDLSPRSL